jgi:hypothetical protein
LFTFFIKSGTIPVALFDFQPLTGQAAFRNNCFPYTYKAIFTTDNAILTFSTAILWELVANIY